MPKLQVPESSNIDPKVLKQLQDLASVSQNINDVSRDAINNYAKHFYNSNPDSGQAEVFGLCLEAAKTMCSQEATIGNKEGAGALLVSSHNLIMLGNSLSYASQQDNVGLSKGEKEQALKLEFSKDLFVMLASSYVGVNGALNLASFGDAQHNNAQQNIHVAAHFAKELVNSAYAGVACLEGLRQNPISASSDANKELESLKQTAYNCALGHNLILDLVEGLESIVQSHMDEKISGLGQVETMQKVQRAMAASSVKQDPGTRTLN